MKPKKKYRELTGKLPKNSSAGAKKADEKFDSATPDLQCAFLKLLEGAKNIPGVNLRYNHQGISLYTQTIAGDRKRECGHMSLLKTDNNHITVFRHAEVDDPRHVFTSYQKKNPRICHGKISSGPEEVLYVVKVWGKSVYTLRQE